MTRRCVSIFKVIGPQLTGLRPSAISASQFIQRNERWIFIYERVSILVAIRERSIIDHRGQKSRDETRADDESVPRMCTVAVLRLPVTNDLDELRENHELEPTTFSKPRAKLYIFRSSGRRIIHPRASFLFRTVEVEDRWWKTACNCESFDAGRWCQCQDRLNRETAVVKNRVGHFFFGTKMVDKKVK